MVQIAIGYTSNLDCALDQDALDSQSHLPKDYTHMEGPSGMISYLCSSGQIFPPEQ